MRDFRKFQIAVAILTFYRIMTRSFVRFISFPSVGLPCLVLPTLVELGLFMPRPAGAVDFLIDGTTRLNTLSIPGTSVHHIRFTGAGYQNPGSLTLSNNGSDSLIFERADSTDSAVDVNNILLHLQGQQGTVVFRRLAFKLHAGGAMFDTNQSGNHNLVFDNCQLSGETQNTRKVFAWSGDNTGAITLSNSMFSQTGALSLSGASTITLSNSMFSQTGALSLSGASTGSTVNLNNNLFNLSGVVDVSCRTQFRMEYNTVNRSQFLLDGKLFSTYSIKYNYVANPPVKNNLPDEGNPRYIALVAGKFASLGSTASNNVRYSGWDGFEDPQGVVTLFTDPSNTPISPAKDSTVAWDWKIPGDAIHGAWNGPTPLPEFNLFPPDSTLSFSVPGGSAAFTLTASPFPRRVSASQGTPVYATTLPDSVRPYFATDLSLSLSGAATVRSITLPAHAEGRPILFAKVGSAFVPGPLGSESGATFLNGTALAKEFIPAFAGQNTFRGSNVSVTGVSGDTALLFSTVVRAGRTGFQTAGLSSSHTRWRMLQKGGKPFGFKDTTTAEGTGDIRFGFGKAGVDIPFQSDSAAWWLGGSAFGTLSDSAGKYWGKIAFAPSLQALLIERLAVGKGSDTIILAQGRIATQSTGGHQLEVDSSSTPDQAQFPDMGHFSKGISLTWPGRGTGDSFAMTLNKSSAFQNAYMKNGSTAMLLSPAAEDSVSVTVSLGVGDSGKTVFLAHKYTIPAGIKTDLAFGADSIKSLLSTTPGELSTDSTGLTSSGLPLASSRFLGGRKVLMDNLNVQGTYTLSFRGRAAFIPDSVHSFTLKGGKWTEITMIRSGSRYALSLGVGDTEIAVLEGLPVFKPSNPPQVAATLGNLSVAPILTAQEKERAKSYSVELFSMGMDGREYRDTSKAYFVDSAAAIPLSPARMYAYRVSYKILAGTESPDTSWIPLESRKLSAKAIQSVPDQNAKLAWHLIGLPFTGAFGKNLKSGISGLKDSSEFFLLDWSGARWDTLVAKDTRNPALQRGKGYFFASTEAYKVKVDSTDTLDLKSFEMNASAEGWKIVTNPFPFPYALDRIKIAGSPISNAMFLADSARANGEVAYSWQPKDTLKAFEGCALYVFGTSKLTFDAFSFQKTGLGKAAADPERSIQITAYTADGFNRTYLVSGGKARSIPYLPVPSTSLTLKISGNLVQAVKAMDEVDQIIALQSARAGKVNINAGSLLGKSPMAILLLDPRSGNVLDLSKNPEVAIDKGETAYRLIAGSPEFVTAKTTAFVQSLSRDLSLSQNFPNPWKGFTQIGYVLPTGYGKIVRGKLEVENLNGRKIFSKDLEDLSVGSHTMLIADKIWPAGVYVYRLAVEAEQRDLHIKKRMVVAK